MPNLEPKMYILVSTARGPINYPPFLSIHNWPITARTCGTHESARYPLGVVTIFLLTHAVWLDIGKEPTTTTLTEIL